MDPASDAASLFSHKWLDTWDRPLAVLLGCETTQISRMRGRDLGDFVVVASHLRFCRQCLEDGYHSVLFQHAAVLDCPRHAQPLEDACPHCAARITPTLRSVREDPWLCPSCLRTLSSFATQQRRKEDPTVFDRQFTTYREALSACAKEVVGHWPGQQNPLGSRARQRQIHRAFLIDPPKALPSPWRFRTETYPLEVVADPKSPTVSDIEPLLRWLIKRCPGAPDAYHLCRSVGRFDVGLRLDRDAHALGVVLFQVLTQFGLVQEFKHLYEWPDSTLEQQGRGGSLILRHSPLLPHYPKLSLRLAQFEVLGLFAVLASRFKPGTPLVDVNWGEPVDNIVFAPSVAIRHDGNRSWALVRVRADERLVERLFRRLSNSRYPLSTADVTKDTGRG